jgi:hypothetical protein
LLAWLINESESCHRLESNHLINNTLRWGTDTTRGTDTKFHLILRIYLQSFMMSTIYALYLSMSTFIHKYIMFVSKRLHQLRIIGVGYGHYSNFPCESLILWLHIETNFHIFNAMLCHSLQKTHYKLHLRYKVTSSECHGIILDYIIQNEPETKKIRNISAF